MRPEPAALAAVPLFASLGDEELERVSAWMETRRADPGERLVSEGATGYSFFVLQEGTAAVTRNGEELANLGPGDFFGELALAGDGRRTATVTATSSVTLAAMFGSQFRLLERDYPDTADRIRRAANERLT
jgi:CRP-like cAMP-binding protein